MTRTRLVMLGTGTPNMLPDRAQNSLAVIVDDTPYIFDCGAGTTQRIAQAITKGMDALAFPNLQHVFLTHLHPDHVTGLPAFIINPWVLDREAVLHIYGPSGTQDCCTHLLAAFERGIHEHRTGLAPINHPLLVDAHEMQAGECYSDDRVRITAFQVSHGNLDALGYSIQTPDKKIVLSGDTCPTETLIEQAKGCDILVHEVYSVAQSQKRPQAWQQYYEAVHTSTYELAQIANQTHPRLLILTHQLFWDATDEDLLGEIREYYDGEVVSARDLDVFD